MPFGQNANMMSAKHAGTGLGLPLAKAMMELHGGTLDIFSLPEKGTSVALVFPALRIRRADRAGKGGLGRLRSPAASSCALPRAINQTQRMEIS